MITPEDIQTREFKKTPLGYSIEEVDKFLDEIIEDYELIYNLNIELKDKIINMNERINNYKSLETTIQNVLILAEKTAEEVKSNAQQKAEEIVSAAQQKALQVVEEASFKEQELSYNLLHLKNDYERTKAKIRHVLATEMDILDKYDIDEL